MQAIGMTLVEEGGVLTKQHSTDLDASKITLQIAPEEHVWGPKWSDVLWDDSKKVFIKVGLY